MLRLYTTLMRVVLLFLIMLLFEDLSFAMSRVPPSNQFFIKGQKVFVSNCILKPSGSVCNIENTGTVLDGVLVETPPGAVENDVKIKISIDTGFLEFDDGTKSHNPIIEIEIGKYEKLKLPLRVAVPQVINEVNKQLSAFYIKENGSLGTVFLTPPQIEQDDVERFSIYTFHSGLFTWVTK